MRARRFLDPNLASRPFENARPVERLSILLWILALLVGGAALWLAADARRESSERQLALDRLTAEASAARENAARLRAELERDDLVEQNVRTDFLNERIAERAFSWNDLFDALGEVMPRGVRIQDLSPLGFGAAERPTGRKQKKTTKASSTALVTMRISGVAEDTESLLTFVDRLYGHPAFVEPNLSHEAAEHGEELNFSLSVGYLPGLRAGEPALAADGAAAAPDGASPPRFAPAAAAAPGAPGQAGTPGGSAVSGSLAESGETQPLDAGSGAVASPGAGERAVAGAPVIGGAGIPRYRPGAVTAPRERTGRYDPAAAAQSPGADLPEGSARSRDNRGTTSGRAGATPGRDNRGAAVGVPVLPAPLRPFASGPEPIR